MVDSHVLRPRDEGAAIQSNAFSRPFEPIVLLLAVLIILQGLGRGCSVAGIFILFDALKVVVKSVEHRRLQT